jgi:hypothetical protein
LARSTILFDLGFFGMMFLRDRLKIFWGFEPSPIFYNRLLSTGLVVWEMEFILFVWDLCLVVRLWRSARHSLLLRGHRLAERWSPYFGCIARRSAVWERRTQLCFIACDVLEYAVGGSTCFYYGTAILPL